MFGQVLVDIIFERKLIFGFHKISEATYGSKIHGILQTKSMRH